MPGTPREPSTLARLLDAAACRLQQAAADASARRLAERLWCLASGVSREQLLLGTAPAPDSAQSARFRDLVERAARGEPIAYLEGSAGFFDLEFEVGPGALVPRDDSECLVELALERIPPDSAAELVDLGTGSGCLLLTLLHHRRLARGTGIDRSAAALEVARRNRDRLGLQGRCRLLRADWLGGVAARSADWIVANPPYVEPSEPTGFGVAEFEPGAALFTPPGDPLFAYREILARARGVLRNSGRLLFEVGAGRAAEVAQAASAAGFALDELRRDLGGVERALLLRPA